MNLQKKIIIIINNDVYVQDIVHKHQVQTLFVLLVIILYLAHQEYNQKEIKIKIIIFLFKERMERYFYGKESRIRMERIKNKYYTII